MKKIYLLLLSLLYIVCFSQKQNYPFPFYENKGQIVDQNGNPNYEVKYLLKSPGLNVQIKKNGFSYDVYEYETKELKKKKPIGYANLDSRKNSVNKIVKYKYHRVDIDFIDSRSNPEILAEGKSEDYENYYNLPNKKEGVSFVHRYKRVTYKNLYHNIDLVFFKPEDSTKPVEYNFLVHPGGKISDIKIKFKGAKTKLNDGKLCTDLRFGEMQENIPNSWIEDDQNQNISVNFKNFGHQIFGFESSVNSSDKTIVIDPTPTRIWGSYFGGDGEEYGEIKPDKNNNIYLFGYTQSSNNIATIGSYQNTLAGATDAFVTKISKDGQRFWGTYYGRAYFDVTGSVDIDENFNVYAAILSCKPNPRYPGNSYYYHQKIAMLKLDSSGNLVFNKEIGSETGNLFFGGHVDEMNIYDLKFLNGKLYVIGDTRLSGFGTPGTFQENISGDYCGFLSKFDAINGDLDYFTYVGGNGATTLYKIFNTNSTGIEIMGWTRATNFPMVNAFQSTNNQDNYMGGNNGLYLQFSPGGNLIKSSYIGYKENYTFTDTKRFGDEVIFAAKMNYKNKICYFLVNTSLNTLTDYKEEDVFNKDGHVYVDSQKNIFMTGRASPNDSWVNQVTTPNSYLPTIGSYSSIFLTKYDLNFQKIWSTFYQGNGGTQLGMVIKDYDDYLYLWGMSSRNTTGIATPGTFQQTTNTTSNDMFIAKFKDCSSFAQLTSNSPICEGKEIQLGANGGANYDWTGPNGFYSTLQNPKIPNAKISDAGTYTCKVTGTGGCDTSTSITIVVGDNIKPIPDTAILPKITGDCTTLITTIPTATDNCKGKITATTTDPLSYSLPGNYTITWKYHDGNGNIETQTQQVEIKQQPLPTANSPQPFCKINKPQISDIKVTATNPKWYDDRGNLLSINTLLVDNTKYYVTQTSSGCESAKTEILITLTDPTAPTGDPNQTFCSASNPTLKDVKILGTGVQWYDSAGKLLPLSTVLKDGEAYYASQTVGSCESTQKLAVKINVATNYLSAHDFSETFCNDTTLDYKTKNLDDYKKQLIANPQDYTFEFRNAAGQLENEDTKLSIGTNIFDVRITSSLGCYQYVKLILTLNPKPNIQLPANPEFCDDTLGISLDAGYYDPQSSYVWNTGENSYTIKANQEKNYTVTVTNQFGCTNSASVDVKKAKLANITNILIVNSSATVIMSVAGDYLYSLDNVNWQSSSKFDNLNNGNYIVYVKTQSGCKLESKSFTIFSLTSIFTPNGDGVNDYWIVSGIENYTNSEIRIIDKNGKLVLDKITKAEPFAWDGKFNGRSLPTDNYWYQIKISDGRILEGYVVIKNRE